MTTRPRLAAAERRADLLDVAVRVFSEGSYRGTTTAEIARRAGVTEPILYRHFASKQDLYLAALEEAWAGLRTIWERVLEDEPDPRNWMASMSSAFLELKEQKSLVASFWIQALTEATDSPLIQERLRLHLHDVHDFVAGVIARVQVAGCIAPERDPGAEAWIFISLGLLSAIGRRLGGLAEDDFERIRAARRAWLTGATV